LRNHPPHQVDAVAELMGHLVAQHDYTAETLSGGSVAFLRGLHEQGHQHMVGDPAGTVPELSGSAERLFTSALETLETLFPLDRDLARAMAARWVEALTVLAR